MSSNRFRIAQISPQSYRHGGHVIVHHHVLINSPDMWSRTCEFGLRKLEGKELYVAASK